MFIDSFYPNNYFTPFCSGEEVEIKVPTSQQKHKPISTNIKWDQTEHGEIVLAPYNSVCVCVCVCAYIYLYIHVEVSDCNWNHAGMVQNIAIAFRMRKPGNLRHEDILHYSLPKVGQISFLEMGH